MKLLDMGFKIIMLNILKEIKLFQKRTVKLFLKAEKLIKIKNSVDGFNSR